MLVTITLCALALLSFGLLLWQFRAARRFPLHAREADRSFAPAITMLKPLKGVDEHTAECLRTWLRQKYRGEMQFLLGVDSEDDAACYVVREVLKEFPQLDASLVIAREALGPNAKVSTLAQLMRRARHPIVCVSDADVRVPEDFLVNAVAPLRENGVGLVNCFYRLANPRTLAMRWEAVAVNADFWSQVLQSNAMKPQDFALGAVMLTRREAVEKIGGFEALLDYLADDYQLGHKIAALGQRIALSPVVVECWDKPMNFRDVWNHQLRWARTIRASQPLPYFFSILSNATLWAALLALFGELGGFPLLPDAVLYGGALPSSLQAALGPIHIPWVLLIFLVVLGTRIWMAVRLQYSLTQDIDVLRYWWMVPAKDFLGAGIWAAAFLGNTIVWRGRKFRLVRGGKLVAL